MNNEEPERPNDERKEVMMRTHGLITTHTTTITNRTSEMNNPNLPMKEMEDKTKWKCGVSEPKAHEMEYYGALPAGFGSARPYGIVTDIHQNDVLLGRGKETINYVGNVRFRQLIEDAKAEYVENKSKNGKDMVARRVWKQVEARGGRFLKKTKEDNGKNGWVEQTMDVAVLKIKQAFQYQLYQKAQKLAEQREALARAEAKVGAVPTDPKSPTKTSFKNSQKQQAPNQTQQAFYLHPSTNAAHNPSTFGHSLPPYFASSAPGRYYSAAVPIAPPRPTTPQPNDYWAYSHPSVAQNPLYGRGHNHAPKAQEIRKPSEDQDPIAVDKLPPVEPRKTAGEATAALVAVRKTGEAPNTEGSAEADAVPRPPSTDNSAAAINGTEPLPADVLLGRGEEVTSHVGNIRFQKLVMDRKRQYLAGDPKEREVIAFEIKRDIDARRGRFMKRVEGTDGMWLPVDGKAIMKKIKQSFLYTYNTESSDQDRSYYKSIAVKEFTENDVLFGRGRKTINNVGNVRFRELISARKMAYASTSIHSEKDKIAREVKAAVEARGGRFLDRIDGLPDSWVPVDEAIVLKKIKLCFRYQHPEPTGGNGTASIPLGIGAKNSSLFEAAKRLAGLPSVPTHQQESIANRSTTLQIQPNDASPDFSALLDGRGQVGAMLLSDRSGDAASRPIHSAELLANDVLLGRGKETLQYIGNVRFRQLIEENKADYVAIPSREEKDRVARIVKAAVESRNGRFLKKVDIAPASGVFAWVEVDESVALLKIKQAFQYVLYQKETKDAGSINDASENAEVSEGTPMLGYSTDVNGRTVDIKEVSVSTFSDENSVRELMEAMKQQLKPCQHLLGGEQLVNTLVENNVRTIERAVSQFRTATSRGPLPVVAPGISASNILACMKQLTDALSTSRNSTAGAASRSDSASPGGNPETEAFYRSLDSQKKPGGGIKAASLPGSLIVQNPSGVTVQQASSDDGSHRASGTATAINDDEELRQNLLSQVSTLSTEALTRLVLAQNGNLPPAEGDNVQRRLSHGSGRMHPPTGQASVPEQPLTDNLRLLTTMADQGLLCSVGTGHADSLQLMAKAAMDQNGGIANLVGADNLLASLLLAERQGMTRSESDAAASASSSAKRRFVAMDTSAWNGSNGAESAAAAARKRRHSENGFLL